jgi:hypothetical protein
MNRILFGLLALVACTQLTACLSSDNKPDTPVVTVRYAKNPNLVLVAWPTVSRATYYTISKDSNGSTGYSQICQGNNPAATSCLDTFSNVTDLVNATYKVSACNSGGCVESAPIKAFSTQSITYFKSYATATGDVFGYTTALSGDGTTLAVGGPGEDSGAGAVHIFTKDSDGHWVQKALLQASNPEAGDQFGASVAVSADGTTVAVGALKEDSNATGSNGDQSNQSAADSGAVYVFIRNGSEWPQQAYLKASNTGAGDDFGYSLALSDSGNTLAVGADREDSSAAGINGDQADNNAQNSGAVYVLTRSGTTWSQQAYFKASNTGAQDAFGYSLGLSGDGNTLAVGAVGEDSNSTGVEGVQTDNSASDSGAAYVFVRSGGNWSQQAYIKASNTDTSDVFSSSIALSLDGNTLAVGAIQESSNATGVNGTQSDNSKQNSGAVYVFTRVSSSWSQQAYLKSSNSDIADGFGFSVALAQNGSTLAVSAPLEDSFATGVNGDQIDNRAVQTGAVYVFTRVSGNWIQKSYIKASNVSGYVNTSTGTPIAEGEQFGYSVALSADACSLAVGAISESTTATGINGDPSDVSGAPRSGAAYVY